MTAFSLERATRRIQSSALTMKRAVSQFHGGLSADEFRASIGSSSLGAVNIASCPGCKLSAGLPNSRHRKTSLKLLDVIVIGAGPAGVFAALRAADLGAKTALVTRDEFGGMAANDGPVPVRTLAQAARLLREARQLGMFGIAVSEPVLNYPRLLERVRTVVNDVRMHSALRAQIDSVQVTVHDHAGTARFVDSHTIETESGLQLRGKKIIICTGGVSRRLSLPGFELTATHSDAWRLTS